ncbi:interleukin-6 receptor subunit beta-like isoform X2 [Plectropomus leopardus]|uniref:interleukin-6 receptor subunit beta-like isoform X2 n=1 Tax=Plectropomus leopardus TaxID=160734 RepID=UPI001C4B4B64|nr:interleukin-6 receptor subunit beta-like isoform X2 [Plectropomus leopardus]
MYTFLALFILAVSPSICKGQHENICNVAPKDQYIEVGSDISIVCQTSCINGKIFWTLNNRPVDESLSYTTSPSHTVLTLRNFTHHSATLQCHSRATHQVLGGTTIRTYSKPSNISCMLRSTDQEEQLLPDLFTCTWKHRHNSSVKVQYSVLSASSQSEICGSLWPTTTCTAKDIESSTIQMGITNITVRAKIAAWNVDSDPYEFDPKRRLQIIRPKLRVTPSSDNVLVEWSRSLSSVSECHCQVNYSKAVDGRTLEWIEIYKTLGEGKRDGKETIRAVDSCSNYTFSVRCALHEAPWSEWSEEKTILTKLNKNDVKLHLWRKIAEPQENGLRKVHAMWMEIPSGCEETFTYKITQTPYKENKKGVNNTETLCGKSTCDIDVNQDAHRMTLTLSHEDALFVEDSVYVPAIGESLPQITDIQTSTHEGVILVNWKSQPVSGYIIDWTHDGNQYYWKQSKYTNTTLTDLLDKKPYNITVTPLFDDKTGHGTQAHQICSSLGDPGNITISVKAYDKSADVRIVMSQETCSGIIVNYTVFLSAQERPQLNVTVDGTEQYISLKDLNPDTHYSVYVEATALTGSTKSSETFLFKTQKFGGRDSGRSRCQILAAVLWRCCCRQVVKMREYVPSRRSVIHVKASVRGFTQWKLRKRPPLHLPKDVMKSQPVTRQRKTLTRSRFQHHT